MFENPITGAGILIVFRIVSEMAKDWCDANPDLEGNIGDYAKIGELTCLSKYGEPERRA
jgi:hypothetical protein